MSAARAHELGLVNEIVDADRLDKAVASWVMIQQMEFYAGNSHNGHHSGAAPKDAR